MKAYVERGLKHAGIKLLGGGETQQLFLPNLPDDVVGTITAFHYTETNNNPENIALKNQLRKMFGDKAVPDIASIAAWDGTHLIYDAVAALGSNADGLQYVKYMEGKKLDSPRGPIMIDPVERDIIQNIYIRISPRCRTVTVGAWVPGETDVSAHHVREYPSLTLAGDQNGTEAGNAS